MFCTAVGSFYCVISMDSSFLVCISNCYITDMICYGGLSHWIFYFLQIVKVSSELTAFLLNITGIIPFSLTNLITTINNRSEVVLELLSICLHAKNKLTSTAIFDFFFYRMAELCEQTHREVSETCYVLAY